MLANYDKLKVTTTYEDGDWVPYGMGSVKTPGGWVVDWDGQIKIDMTQCEADDAGTSGADLDYITEVLQAEPLDCGDDVVVVFTTFNVLSWNESEAIIEPTDYDLR